MKNAFAHRLPARYTQALLDMLVTDYQVAAGALGRARELCQPLAEIPEGFISLQQFAQVCDIAVDCCDDPWLGVKFGRRLSPISHGALGAAASSCRRVDEMFQLLGRFADHLFPAHIENESRDDRFILRSIFPQQIEKNREFHAQVVIAGSLKLLQDSVGYLPSDIRIAFPFSVSAEKQSDYQQFFPYDLSFNSSVLLLEFPISYIRTPLLSADPTAHEIYVKACETITEQLQTSHTLGESIRRLLEGYMLDGYGSQYPSLEQIADMLHISSRALRNRLAKEQLSFREILSECRTDKAKQLLGDDNLTVAVIAEQLGYKDTANFCRAFKRETGVSPSEFRLL
jgi:AraC-like DNA-binding protein